MANRLYNRLYDEVLNEYMFEYTVSEWDEIDARFSIKDDKGDVLLYVFKIEPGFQFIFPELNEPSSKVKSISKILQGLVAAPIAGDRFVFADSLYEYEYNNSKNTKPEVKDADVKFCCYFAHAARNDFRNGAGKSFLMSLNKFLFDSSYDGQYFDSSAYKFSIDMRNILEPLKGVKTNKKDSFSAKRSASHMSYESVPTRTTKTKSSKTKSSKTYIGKGLRTPDFVIVAGNHPLFIFELKSSDSMSAYREGVAQLLSFGLAHRHTSKISYYLNLILITPSYWYFCELPPFGKELPEKMLFIKVFIFTKLAQYNNARAFDRERFIWLLQYIEQLSKGFGERIPGNVYLSNNNYHFT